jgi:CRP/FNR family cyclic AMP-dependent transcriptional regulator
MSWLDALPATERAEVESRRIPRTHRRGETIVAQGDPSTNVYLLASGHVAVRITTAHGESVTTTVLGPGAGFGELASMTAQEVRTASVVALDDVLVRVLPGRTFDELRTRVPAVTAAIAESLADRLRDLSDRFSELALEPVQRRCGRRLVELADLFADGDAPDAVIPLTQEDLAGIVGATRPTVNQVMGQLAHDGLIRLHRGAIEVPDRRRLREHVR